MPEHPRYLKVQIRCQKEKHEVYITMDTAVIEKLTTALKVEVAFTYSGYFNINSYLQCLTKAMVFELIYS